jgi:toxin HigB-1
VAIRSYRDKRTRDIAAGNNTKAARRSLPVDLHHAARRRLAFLGAARLLDDLRAWPGLQLHKLTGEREGQHAVRINDQYRICFVWSEGDADSVQITDYH